ncbi:hypothetical protein [Kistimonas asteriae]|uniref:hypothetical protein n=1 Tax=Kistimonas asteriae TaxID=517724 RepID=UPI001BA6F2D0|nr:hypothetical protein [Kistimonas asteriae]
MVGIPGSYTGSSSRSVDRSEEVSNHGSEGDSTTPQPYTVEVKGELTPKQKQDMLAHLDEKNLSPDQRQQAVDDIEQVDGWFKSVAKFFKKNAKSILAFSAFITVGIGLSIVLPELLPVFGILLLATLVAFIFLNDDFSAQNVNNNDPANNNSTQNNNDNNQSSRTEESNKVPPAVEENPLSPAEVRRKENSGFSTPRVEQAGDSSTWPKLRKAGGPREPNEFEVNQGGPEVTLRETGGPRKPEEFKVNQGGPEVTLRETGGPRKPEEFKVNQGGPEVTLRETGGPRRPEEFKVNQGGPEVTLRETGSSRKAEEFKPKQEEPWDSPIDKGGRFDDMVVDENEIDDLLSDVNALLIDDTGQDSGETGLHPQSSQTGGKDASSVMSRYRPYLDMEDDDSGLRKTGGPRKPEEFKVNQGGPEVTLRETGGPRKPEEFKVNQGGPEVTLRETGSSRKAEEFKPKQEEPWDSPIDKGGRFDDMVVDENEIDDLLSDVNALLIDDTGQDSGETGLHPQSSQTGGKDASSVMSRYRPYLDMEDDDSGLRKTGGPRKPEEFKVNQGGPEVTLRETGGPRKPEEFKVNQGGPEVTLRETGGPRKPEEFKANQGGPEVALRETGGPRKPEEFKVNQGGPEVTLRETGGSRKAEEFKPKQEEPWDSPIDKGGRFDDMVVDENEVDDLLSDVNALLIDDTGQDSGETGLHPQSSQTGGKDASSVMSGYRPYLDMEDDDSGLRKTGGPRKPEEFKANQGGPKVTLRETGGPRKPEDFSVNTQNVPWGPPIGDSGRFDNGVVADNEVETLLSEVENLLSNDVKSSAHSPTDKGHANVLDVSSEEGVSMAPSAMYERAKEARKEEGDAVFLWNSKLTPEQEKFVREMLNALAAEQQQNDVVRLNEFRDACFSAARLIDVRN